MRDAEASLGARTSPGTVLVRRPRLEEALSSWQRVTVLRAPAAFGKSTLLRQWAGTRASGSVGWLSMSHDTASSDSFWQAFGAAVATATIDDDAAAAPERTVPRIVATARLRTLTSPLTMIIDAYEHAEDHQLERDILDALHLAPELRLIVATRAEGLFSRRRLQEFSSLIIGSDELCFTDQELEELLAANDVSASLAGVLHTEAAGWPGLSAEVATRLASSPENDAQTVEAVAREHLREYNDEHLYDPRLREVALRLSICDTVTSEIARHLLGDVDVASARALASGGLLSLTQTEDGQHVYQWPRLPQRFLQEEFRRRYPADYRAAHASMAAWFHDRREPAAALRHAIQAEDWPRVVTVIEEQWVFLFPDNYEVLAESLTAIPRSFSLASSGVIAVGEINSHWSDAIIRDAVDQLPDSLPGNTEDLEEIALSSDALRRYSVALATMVALRIRGNVARVHRIAGRIERLATVSTHNPRLAPLLRRAPFYVQTAVSRIFAGDLDGALRSLRMGQQANTTREEMLETADAISKTALVYALRGETTEAESWLERAVQNAVAAPWTLGFIAQTTAFTEALIGLDHLDEERTNRALEALAHPGIREPGWEVFAEYLHARRGLIWGDPEGALHQLRGARVTLHTWLREPSLGRALLEGIESDLLLSLDRATEASSLVPDPHAHPVTAAAFARVQLAGSVPSRALSTADKFLTQPTLTTRTRIEFDVLAGEAYGCIGEPDLSAAAYARARTTAEDSECWQPLTLTVDRDHPLRQALPAHLSDYVSPLPAQAKIIDLTEREREILDLLAAGNDRPTIARQLYLSVNTVKFHMRGLYRKLGSSNAHDTIAAAVRHGLITPSATEEDA